MQHIRSLFGIDEYELPNGLKVLLMPDASSGNVTINITYLVGSRHEGRGEAGMAHLLEHMLFKGTKNLKDVKGALQDRGANFNATTWYDRTNYYETLTPNLENLRFALELEADRMVNSLILEEDLAQEMTVVRNEFEMGENNPVHVLHDHVLAAAYKWHNYGKSTIGNRSDIERVPAKALKNFYKNYYQPDNAVLIIAGQFDEKVAMEMVEHYFGKIERPQREIDKTYTKEPAQDGPKEVILERVGDMASVALAYHIVSASHKDFIPLKILFEILTDEPAGFLYKKLVESKKCSELFSMVYALNEPGMALCFVRPSEQTQSFDIRDELMELVEDQAINFISSTEVSRIKSRLLKRIKQNMSSSKEFALKLSESIAAGDYRLYFWHSQEIENVSLEDVKTVFNKYIIRSNRTSGVFLPQKEINRIEIDDKNILNNLDSLIKSHDIQAGENFIAKVPNIEQRILRNDFANGKSAFLCKKTKGQIVRSKIIFRFSNERSLAPLIDSWSLIPSMLWRGCEKYDFQSTVDKIDSLASSLELDSGPGVLAAFIKSEKKYIKPVLELVNDMVCKPLFLEKEFNILKDREIDDYEEIKTDPQRVGFHELERLKYPWRQDSIHYVPSYEERILQLKSMKRDDLVSAYKDFSLGNIHLSMVGDFNSEEITGEINNIFKDRLLDKEYSRIARPFIANIPKELVIDTKDKEMAILAYAYNFALRDDDPDFPALKLACYMFGENMNSRLMHRIREREGISYGAGSYLEVGRYEKNASFNMYAMASPDKVSKAKKAMEEEWELFLKEGVNDNELNSAKDSIYLSFENSLANDGNLASSMAIDLDINRDFYFRENIFNKIKLLNKADIYNAINNWWSNYQFSIVVAGDQARFK